MQRLLVLGGMLVAVPLAAQQPVPTPPPPPPLAVGTMAPDFTLPAADINGVLAKPVHLADLRGKTVVIAFFYRARTKG